MTESYTSNRERARPQGAQDQQGEAGASQQTGEVQMPFSTGMASGFSPIRRGSHRHAIALAIARREDTTPRKFESAITDRSAFSLHLLEPGDDSGKMDERSERRQVRRSGLHKGDNVADGAISILAGWRVPEQKGEPDAAQAWLDSSLGKDNGTRDHFAEWQAEPRLFGSDPLRALKEEALAFQQGNRETRSFRPLPDAQDKERMSAKKQAEREAAERRFSAKLHSDAEKAGRHADGLSGLQQALETQRTAMTDGVSQADQLGNLANWNEVPLGTVSGQAASALIGGTVDNTLGKMLSLPGMTLGYFLRQMGLDMPLGDLTEWGSKTRIKEKDIEKSDHYFTNADGSPTDAGQSLEEVRAVLKAGPGVLVDTLLSRTFGPAYSALSISTEAWHAFVQAEYHSMKKLRAMPESQLLADPVFRVIYDKELKRGTSHERAMHRARNALSHNEAGLQMGLALLEGFFRETLGKLAPGDQKKLLRELAESGFIETFVRQVKQYYLKVLNNAQADTGSDASSRRQQ